MNRQIGIILILHLTTTYLPGQNAILHGQEEDYAGFKIPVEYVYNPFTGNSRTLDTLSIDEHGLFNVDFPIKELTWIHLEIGIYECIMLLEPEYNYRIRLPLRRDLTEAEIKNPFFESLIYHLQVLETRSHKNECEIQAGLDLNTQIYQFDTLLFRINTDLLLAWQKQQSYPLDSVIASIEETYDDNNSDYFSRYRNYRYGLLEVNSRTKSLVYIYDKYLSTSDPEIYNPAYMELFNKMYDRFFYFFSRTDDGEDLNQIINLEHDLESLREVLKKHSSIPDDTIADLVIMKEVNESFYRDLFYKKALLILLDSLIVDSRVPHYQYLAEDIHANLAKLMIGTKAPGFSLKDQLGNTRTLNDFLGKYVYLMFCTPENYACFKEYPFLKSLHSKHNEYLEVLTIMLAESHDEMVKFLEKNNYEWTSLYYGKNERVLDLYNIRSYPTCFLIGPDGLLIQSPATLPTDGFESQLFRIMLSRGDL